MTLTASRAPLAALVCSPSCVLCRAERRPPAPGAGAPRARPGCGSGTSCPAWARPASTCSPGRRREPSITLARERHLRRRVTSYEKVAPGTYTATVRRTSAAGGRRPRAVPLLRGHRGRGPHRRRRWARPTAAPGAAHRRPHPARGRHRPGPAAVGLGRPPARHRAGRRRPDHRRGRRAGPGHAPTPPCPPGPGPCSSAAARRRPPPGRPGRRAAASTPSSPSTPGRTGRGRAGGRHRRRRRRGHAPGVGPRPGGGGTAAPAAAAASPVRPGARRARRPLRRPGALDAAPAGRAPSCRRGSSADAAPRPGSAPDPPRGGRPRPAPVLVRDDRPSRRRRPGGRRARELTSAATGQPSGGPAAPAGRRSVPRCRCPARRRRAGGHHAAGLRPVRIAIPSIGVDTPLVDLGVAGRRLRRGAVRPEQAGWLDTSPAPGQQGPAVVAGHVDSTTGPAVFARLSELSRATRSS